MYITELKEHVILHKDRESIGIVEGDEIVETGEYDESVQHLIIDGQVRHLRCYLCFKCSIIKFSCTIDSLK